MITNSFCARAMTLCAERKKCLSEFTINKDEPTSKDELEDNHQEQKSNDQEELKSNDQEEPKPDDHEQPTVKFNLITWIYDNPWKSFIAILALLSLAAWIIFKMDKPKGNEIKLNMDKPEDNEINFPKLNKN